MSGLVEVIRSDGSQEAVAEKLRTVGYISVKQQNISYWMRNGLPRKWVGPLSEAYPEIPRHKFEEDVFRNGGVAA